MAFALFGRTAAETAPRSGLYGSQALRADVEGYTMAACLIRQDAELLREQGYLWGGAVLQRGHGSLADWAALANAVDAEAARRPMPTARGDEPVHAPLKAMPLLFCHELVRTRAVLAAMAWARRHLAPAYRAAGRSLHPSR